MIKPVRAIPIIWSWLLIVFFSVLGCNASILPVRDPEHMNDAMAFGHFDMSTTPYVLTYVSLRDVERDKPYRGIRGVRIHVYDNGTFFAENLRPGRYRLVAAVSGGMVFPLGQEHDTLVTIAAGELKYLGTYQLQATDHKLIKTDSDPDELTLLSIVRELVMDTRWAQRLQRRLQQVINQDSE